MSRFTLFSVVVRASVLASCWWYHHWISDSFTPGVLAFGVGIAAVRVDRPGGILAGVAFSMVLVRLAITWLEGPVVLGALVDILLMAAANLMIFGRLGGFKSAVDSEGARTGDGDSCDS